MSKTLFLFLFSERVDPYVNVVAYAYDQLQIRQVVLVHVKGAITALTDSEAALVSNRIWVQINGLASGEYVVFPRKTENYSASPPEKLPLNHTSRIDIYRKISEEFFTRAMEPVNYDNLKSDLKALFKKHAGTSPHDYVIDLTAAAKMATIDVFTTCISLGVDNIYLFELTDLVNPTNPEASLYHALAPNGYKYTRITNSPPVVAGRAAFLRKERLHLLVLLAALLVLGVSLIFLLTVGTDSVFLQLLALLSAVVGVVAPISEALRTRR